MFLCILFEKRQKNQIRKKKGNILKKINSLKKDEVRGVSLLNFGGGPGVPLLNFMGGAGSYF